MLEDDSRSKTLLALWKPACANFDIGVRASIVSLVTTLEQITQVLAQDLETRVELGADASLWADLRKLWRDLARDQLTFWDADDEEEDGSSKKEKDLRTVCGCLAKFTRNLVAGVPDNQVRAYENEPDIRRLLHYHTSWSAMEDSEAVSVARILAQALSNIVTTNEVLMSKLWDTYMSLPEDQVVLIRLLASPDPRTVMTVLIFILNCIHGSRMRTTMLTRTAVGSRVCVSLLDDMLKLYEAEESSVGAQAFDVGYDILTQLIEQGLVPDLYSKFTIPDEIVTPHQTTLLKIVDSYLQSIQMSTTTPATAKTIKIHRKLSPMLAKCFLDLSAYARRAVERSLRPPGPSAASPSIVEVQADDPSTPKPAQLDPPAELDVMLPKVCEALVLVTQSDQAKVDQTQDIASEPDLKAFFNETRSSDGGVVEGLIDLLRLLDLFLPRINFGKPVSSTPSGPDIQTPTQPSAADPTGFQYLKRDLVRLLGILCHGVKAVQDHARACGGIPVVMNLCVIDERNPYLREHAIFTLHCLLKDNRENQAVVDAIKPSHEWDENGVLKDASGSVRR
ncbi:spinocerebellar ataxia type 10 protein domain-containing protein [Lyophyllum atratum]|nr:spinocerebellar ataxia type 10 protein domain-containing protein [Lyophyllum atratum]